eukprot:UN31592
MHPRFNLTLTEDAKVKGINGILNAYKKSLQKVSLSGPRLFEPLISGATDRASTDEKSDQYDILIIFTAGDAADGRKTWDRLIKACDKPLSVVIIGLGDAKFDGNRELP